MSSGFNQVSDGRLKRDIEDGSKYGLDDLLKIKVRDAVLISEGVKKPTIIAQELHSLIPEAVRTNGDDGACELASDTLGWGVSYTTLVPLLIKSLQELTRKVESLEARIADRDILDTRDHPEEVVGWQGQTESMVQSAAQSAGSPTVSAMVAPRVPMGLGGPTVLSRQV
jgi:hypothetical protein